MRADGDGASGWGIRLAVTMLLASCVALAASPAMAGPREDAVRLADAGFESMEQRQHAQAAAQFKEAAKLYYSPVIALYWARAELEQGHLVEARRIITTIEAKPMPNDAKPSWRKAVEDAIILGVELDGRIPTVVVSTSGATDAAIAIDGESARAEQPVKIDPGEHRVVITPASGEPHRERFRVVEGEAHRVEVDLGDAGPAANTSIIPPIVAFGVGGVGLVMATVTGIIFVGKTGDLEAACPNRICPVEQEALLDETTTLGTVSTVGWVLTGLGVAAGTVLLFVPLGDQEPTLTVRATPTAASVALRF